MIFVTDCPMLELGYADKQVERECECEDLTAPLLMCKDNRSLISEMSSIIAIEY